MRCRNALPCARCRNFALVADEAIALRPGLNVITGESGAGKSVLVTALGQLLGAPAAEGCVRAPATSACVEGRLHLPAASLVRGAAAPHMRTVSWRLWQYMSSLVCSCHMACVQSARQDDQRMPLAPIPNELLPRRSR